MLHYKNETHACATLVTRWIISLYAVMAEFCERGRLKTEAITISLISSSPKGTERYCLSWASASLLHALMW